MDKSVLGNNHKQIVNAKLNVFLNQQHRSVAIKSTSWPPMTGLIQPNPYDLIGQTEEPVMEMSGNSEFRCVAIVSGAMNVDLMHLNIVINNLLN